MTIILVAKSNMDRNFIVERIAEDIWLLEDGGAISFIDLFVRNAKDSSPIRSIKLASIGKTSKIIDVSHFFPLLAKHWAKSVATDQYKSGVVNRQETKQKWIMSVDGIEANVSKKNCRFHHSYFLAKHTGNFSSTIELAFYPPIEAGESRGLKLCRHISNLTQREDSVWELDLYPYSSSGVSGVNFFQKEGITTESMVEVKSYYFQIILPPSYDYDRARSTKVRSEDYCYCDTCSKFCPYVSSLLKDVSLSRERRLFLRFQAKDFVNWTDKAIIHLFYFSKPKISKAILETASRKKASRLSQIAIHTLLILEISNQPLDAKTLHRQLTLKGENVTIGAIYYTLRKLKNQGLINEISQKSGERGKPPTLFNITSEGRQLLGL